MTLIECIPNFSEGRRLDVIDEIAASLQGHWRAEHLFALKQALAAFDFCGTQLAECDAEIEAQLQALQATEAEPAKGKKRGRARNAPKFDLRTQLFRMCGVDLTRIDEYERVDTVPS